MIAKTDLILVTIIVISTGISITWVHDTISDKRWEKSRPLTWDDFLGIPNPVMPYNAYIKTRLDYQISHDWIITQGSCHYWFTKVEGIAYMSKMESFVKEQGRNDFILNHEQGHFDLTQIYAKRFIEKAESELLNKEFLCPGNDAGKISNEANAKAKVILNQVVNGLQSMQDNYDTETNHGLYYDGQKKWDSTIKNLLNN